MGEIYTDSPYRKSGTDIGITGVRFFKLPHKVRQCILWKRHFQSLSLNGVRTVGFKAFVIDNECLHFRM